MVNNRLDRIKEVLRQIEMDGRYESSFDKLYEILQDEYHLEGGSSATYVMGNYRHHLEQTIRKQAKVYLVARRKRPVKGAPDAYDDFIRNFKQDVQDEIMREEYVERHKQA